jgi:predicted nucleotidyltransferase
LRRQASSSIRHKVAREAASLLYTQQEKEYKQAKLRAAETLGARSLPSNKDIALELDKMADEIEGPERAERLVQMRKDALRIMVMLGDFHPRLIGSVWRGSVNKNSDIDIEAFTSDQNKVLERITGSGLAVSTARWIFVSKGSELERVFQVHMTVPSKDEIELIVRSPEKREEPDVCEIYGDTVKGLNIHQLRGILLTDPLHKFVPAKH